MTCSNLQHAAMKAMPNVWRNLPMCGSGYQDDGVDTLELRQCDGHECRSTLAVHVPRIVCRVCGREARCCGHGAQVFGRMEHATKGLT